jgi:hypothetical protein
MHLYLVTKAFKGHLIPLPTRPAVFGHGAILRLFDSSPVKQGPNPFHMAAPGTIVPMFLHEALHGPHVSVQWSICTNCSRYKSGTNLMSADYSTHLMIMCDKCGAYMMLDADITEACMTCFYVVDSNHVFLPAKVVARIRPILEDEDDFDCFYAPVPLEEPWPGFLPCNSTILNRPEEPYPPQANFCHDGPTVYVQFADGTMGSFSGD